ncbi:E3 ubiquitin-protein ligase PUB23-like [Salvia miltiorrhiza]|uniref:E3 ubiquitin-protein ligase PUB23-like n=1 Tax=Salvia miltiorrhiza TaxID=226208 RepID=UPI0025ACA0BC|nr:E3 ubiquitin-protein ligase PUB23-like [Salvia miltiorrhiza]
MAEIEVPSYFLCPISLEIMKDPVTISTGITFDRDSIEKWIFSYKNRTCPLTKQPLSDADLTPNVTLRRLIQSWCTLHASHGVERLPTPKPPVTKPQLLSLLAGAGATPQTQIKCLHRLRSIASTNQTNRICMEKSGAADFLAALVVGASGETSGEALSILHSLQLSESSLKTLASRPEFVNCLTRFMQSSSYESRAYAVMMLKSMAEVADDPAHLFSSNPQILIELIQILKDQICKKATKAALKVLIAICAWGRNKIKAAQAGLVGVMINLLLESTDKRSSEMMLTVLDLVCQCAEGRAELLQHGAGLAVVSKKILRVSHVGSERAVRVLHSVARFSATAAVLQEMVQIGVVAKLCLLLQVECGVKTKERARDILKMHARAWRNSSCVPHTFVSLCQS